MNMLYNADYMYSRNGTLVDDPGFVFLFSFWHDFTFNLLANSYANTLYGIEFHIHLSRNKEMGAKYAGILFPYQVRILLLTFLLCRVRYKNIMEGRFQNVRHIKG